MTQEQADQLAAIYNAIGFVDINTGRAITMLTANSNIGPMTAGGPGYLFVSMAHTISNQEVYCNTYINGSRVGSAGKWELRKGYTFQVSAHGYWEDVVVASWINAG